MRFNEQQARENYIEMFGTAIDEKAIQAFRKLKLEDWMSSEAECPELEDLSCGEMDAIMSELEY